LIEFLLNILNNIVHYIIIQLSSLFNQIYWFLWSYLDEVKVNGYFILGYIIFLEVTGITSITIDIIIEDILKPRKLKIIKYKQ